MGIGAAGKGDTESVAVSVHVGAGAKNPVIFFRTQVGKGKAMGRLKTKLSGNGKHRSPHWKGGRIFIAGCRSSAARSENSEDLPCTAPAEGTGQKHCRAHFKEARHKPFDIIRQAVQDY